nr:MAG TPA: C2H2 type zinc-finger protein [Caudoviricetes sp.]
MKYHWTKWDKTSYLSHVPFGTKRDKNPICPVCPKWDKTGHFVICPVSFRK